MQVQYTLESLKDRNVKELKKLARDNGIQRFDRDGESFNLSYARRKELLGVLEKHLLDARKSPFRLDDYQDVETEQESIAKKFFDGVLNKERWELMGLKEILIRNAMSGDPFSTVEDFFKLVSQFRPTIERALRERTDEINPHTLLNWRSSILQKIEAMVKNLPASDGQKEEEFQETYARFYHAVMSGFADVGKMKREKGNVELKHREDNAVEVNVCQLVEWAADRVTNLPEKKSAWAQVAVAVMVLTGRRQSEVMATGGFEATDSDSHLVFSGQLKRHEETEVPPFEIPVLGQAAQGVIDAVEWLEARGKREETAKAAHNRFSRYLSAAAKQVCGYITSPAQDWYWSADSKGNQRDRRKCHLFRQIYGQVVIPVFFPRIDGRGKKAKRILTEVMGHADTASSRSHAAEAYDADVFVLDVHLLS